MTGVQGLAISVLPLALAAVGQAIVVISGGIDLSIGSLMALTSVIAASQMKGQSEGFGVGVVIGVLVLGLVLGAINGALVVVTRVPDIVVTLAMSFVWAGFALLVLNRAGRRFVDVAEGDHQGLARQRVDPQGGDRPDRRHRRRSGSRSGARRLGLPIYAVGSDRLAAFRSGVSVGRTKVLAYALARAVRRTRRPLADREHRHRDAGARARTRC